MKTLETDRQGASWQGGGEKLRGRVAFVTGGTRGIGAAICRSLGNQQATVAAGYGYNAERAKAFAADYETLLGTRPSLHGGNVASAEDCRRTIGEVIDQHGRLDQRVKAVARPGMPGGMRKTTGREEA
jgi:NAD(P)-dependent dehydrogenase (short-subunit alcohol dehydrogenase family)